MKASAWHDGESFNGGAYKQKYREMTVSGIFYGRRRNEAAGERGMKA
jgi:hypothetical protein